MPDRPVGAVVGDDSHEMKRFAPVPGSSHSPEESGIGEKASLLDGTVDPDPVEQNPAAGAEMEVSGLGIADRVSGHADGFPRSFEGAVREFRPQFIEMRGPGFPDEVSESLIPQPPAIQD